MRVVSTIARAPGRRKRLDLPPPPVGRSRRTVRILGHRGASHDAPENTLAAFQLALDQGADGVELDARLCGSGEVVVFHDARLERLTGASGRVADTPWDALARLEVRARPPGAPAGRIPLLAEVLEALPRSAFINVELKSEDLAGTAVAGAAGALLAAGRHEDHLVVSSFEPRCLVRLALGYPRIPRGLLLDPDRPQWLQRTVLLPLLARDAVHPEAAHIREADVRRWHAGGRQVAVWTVDDPDVARRLRAWGVDACITNRPGALRAALGR
ncbi:MAG: glycerophosphodiester phosphodiesterase [Myxococcaceae bacterium]